MILLPRLFNVLCRSWGVPSAIAVECWQAVDTAEGAKPRAWRAQLLTYGAGNPNVADTFVRREMPPRVVVEALEALVAEGRLTRGQSNTMMAHVLRRVQADGTWQP
jgi:hypothetical protein